MATSRGRGGRAAQSGSPMPAPKLQRRGSAGQAKRLCGCRNRERLRAAAPFPYGGSGPSPEPAFPRCTRPRARVRKRLCAAAACPHVRVAQATAGLRRCRSVATACGASGRPGRGAIRPVAECRQAAGLSRSRSGARGCRKGPLEKKGAARRPPPVFRDRGDQLLSTSVIGSLVAPNAPTTSPRVSSMASSPVLPRARPMALNVPATSSALAPEP